MWLLIIIASLVAFIYGGGDIWVKYKYTYFAKLGFKFVRPSFPYGSIINVGRTEHISDFYKREYDNHKNKAPAFGIFMFMRKCLVLTDLDLVKDVLVKHFDTFHQHGFDIDFNNEPLFNHLFFKDGQEWKDLRAKLSPTFTSGRVKMMFPIVSQAADRMIEYLKPLANIDSMEMKQVYSSFTTEVIANVAFGLDTKCLGNSDNDFKKLTDEIFEPSTRKGLTNLFIVSFPKLSSILGLTFISKKMQNIFMKIIRDNMEYREKNNIQRNDFFQLLLDVKNSEVGLTFEEFAANCFIFLLAGFETSSSVMTFCTYELALNQDIQNRLREEIEEVLERYKGEVTYDAIMEMKYLDMVFNETLRKHPIAEHQNRRAVKDFPIPNTNLVIPAGMNINIPTVGIHNDERFYDNPQKFDPERFTDENIKKRHPFAFIPFSEGPRICIGLRFGTMQTKIGLIKLLRNFKILPCSKTLIPMEYAPSGAMQSPKGGLWLKLEKLS